MKNIYTTPKLRLSLFATENVMTLSGVADSKIINTAIVKPEDFSADMGDRVRTLSWGDFKVNMAE